MADDDATPAHHGRSRSLAHRAATELGLSSLWLCARDAKLLIAARFVRLFAYGASTLVLVRHLEVLGVSPARAGLFMTLTLAGDVGISFALTLIADGVGRRVVLALGAALMAASGIVFAIAEDYWVLLAAAVLGVISPRYVPSEPFTPPPLRPPLLVLWV
jgi:MFS family permease